MFLKKCRSVKLMSISKTTYYNYYTNSVMQNKKSNYRLKFETSATTEF